MEDDIQSKVLAFAFGLSAEIERNLISLRTKEAMALRKQSGIKLGRPEGSSTSPEKIKLSGKEKAIQAMMKNGIPKSEIARRCHVNRSTLYRFLEKNGLSGNADDTGA